MIHVTHRRLVRRVWASLLAVRRDGVLYELLLIERLLPHQHYRPMFLEERLMQLPHPTGAAASASLHTLLCRVPWKGITVTLTQLTTERERVGIVWSGGNRSLLK